MKMAVCDIMPFSLTEADQCFEGASIIRVMMDAVSTSEMSANFYKITRHNIPQYAKMQNTWN
jgi:hypothetical protein